MTSLFLLFFDPQTGSFFFRREPLPRCIGASAEMKSLPLGRSVCWKDCRIFTHFLELEFKYLHKYRSVHLYIYLYIFLYMHVCTYIYLYIYILRSTRHFRLWRSLTCIASVCIQPMTSCGITSCARCRCCWCSHIGAGLQRKGNAGCVGFQLLTVAIVVVGGLTLV